MGPALAFAIASLRGFTQRFLSNDEAQDTFEYIIIIGVVVVAVILAAFFGVGNNLINFVVSQTQDSVGSLYSSV